MGNRNVFNLNVKINQNLFHTYFSVTKTEFLHNVIKLLVFCCDNWKKHLKDTFEKQVFNLFQENKRCKLFRVFQNTLMEDYYYIILQCTLFYDKVVFRSKKLGQFFSIHKWLSFLFNLVLDVIEVLFPIVFIC